MLGEARKYLGLGLELEDLVQEGMLGLNEAIMRWKPGHEARFLSYARWWIMNSLVRAVADTGRIVRLPVNRSQLAADMAAYRRGLLATGGQEPSREDLAEHFGVALDWIDDVLRADEYPMSLDMPLGEGGNFTLADVLPAGGALPDMAEENSSECGMLWSLIETVPSRRSRLILRMWGEGASLREIGDIVELSAERVRQVKEEALDLVRREAARRERGCARRVERARSAA